MDLLHRFSGSPFLAFLHLYSGRSYVSSLSLLYYIRGYITLSLWQSPYDIETLYTTCIFFYRVLLVTSLCGNIYL